MALIRPSKESKLVESNYIAWKQNLDNLLSAEGYKFGPEKPIKQSTRERKLWIL